MIPEIQNWLSGPKNYLVGVELYKQFGTNQVWKDLFAKSQTSFLEKKLIDELRKVLQEVKPQKVEIVKTPEIKHEVVNLQMCDDKEFIKRIERKKSELFREAAGLHSHLHHMNEKEAFEAANVIIKNFSEIQNCWTILDNFNATGYVPKQLSSKLTLKEFMAKMKNIPTYISKIKKGLPDLQEDKKAKALQDLAQYEAELERLNQMMEEGNVVIQTN